VAFAFATALILGVTLLHWSDFLAVGLPHQPVWMFDYIVDPLLGLTVVHFARLWPPWSRQRHKLTPLLVGQAVIFGVVGLALLVAPDVMAAIWPWALPPVLGQVYGCFFLTFALGAGVAAGEVEPRAIRGFLLSTLALMVLVLLASGLHLDRFKAEPVTAIWFAAFGLGLVVFAGVLAISSRLTQVPRAQVATR
jgi:hypothetical protein